jgi:hypothetical protein
LGTVLVAIPATLGLGYGGMLAVMLTSRGRWN